ncbi:hypothetical protein ABTZ57_04030 [Streptomyces sp. NPDC094048]|uniref:hypothetical protein n=1 Tax=Streptomyces sp. NPDC094048 TaxID=3155207 RepID=UPI00332DA8C5
MALEADGWVTVGENTLVLARIDHEEPYWAEKAAQALNTEGITTEITPSLREAIDEEWTWANYPMPWCTRSEIREVPNQAQKIYDDIQYGHLRIHAQLAGSVIWSVRYSPGAGRRGRYSSRVPPVGATALP